MKYTNIHKRMRKFRKGFVSFFLMVVICMLSAPVSAGQGPIGKGPMGKGPMGEGPYEGCKLLGSWIGYQNETGDAWWISTASGQNASVGTSVLEVPGFDVTFPVGEPPVATFPDAVKATDLRGTWVRTGGNSFAYTVLGLAVDANGVPQYISKLSGTETLMDECNTMFLENTALEFFLPSMDPFMDDPIIGPVPFPDHYGYRMKVDLPD